MITKILLFFYTLILVSCASLHPGNKSQPLKHENEIKLNMSAQNTKGPIASNFQLIEVTLENQTQDWMRIDKIRPIFSDEGLKILSVVVGDDLKFWAEAQALQHGIDSHNREMKRLAVMGIGSVSLITGELTNNQKLKNIGTATVGITQLVILADILYNITDTVEGVEAIPPTHLYGPISIPPQMSLRRWILINKPANQDIGTIVFDVRTIDGDGGLYAIEL